MLRYMSCGLFWRKKEWKRDGIRMKEQPTEDVKLQDEWTDHVMEQAACVWNSPIMERFLVGLYPQCFNFLFFLLFLISSNSE